MNNLSDKFLTYFVFICEKVIDDACQYVFEVPQEDKKTCNTNTILSALKEVSSEYLL